MHRFPPLNVLEEVRRPYFEKFVLERIPALGLDLMEAVDVELADKAAEVGVLEEAGKDRRCELHGVVDNKGLPPVLFAPGNLFCKINYIKYIWRNIWNLYWNNIGIIGGNIWNLYLELEYLRKYYLKNIREIFIKIGIIRFHLKLKNLIDFE